MIEGLDGIKCVFPCCKSVAESERTQELGIDLPVLKMGVAFIEVLEFSWDMLHIFRSRTTL